MRTGNRTVKYYGDEMFTNRVKNFTSPVHQHFTRKYNITLTACNILLYSHSFSYQRNIKVHLVSLDHVFVISHCSLNINYTTSDIIQFKEKKLV